LDGTARYGVLNYAQGVLSAWLLHRWILPRCTHAFVQSEQMRADLSAHDVNPTALTAVPMGIAPDEFSAAWAVPTGNANADPQCVTLAYLGTLKSQRRLEILVDILHLVRERGIEASLLLVGDGEKPDDRLRLERRSKELGVQQYIEITGFLPRATALARVTRAQVCLSPFYPTPVLRSTSPTKLVEYLALGLPVVANDHPEQRRVLRASRAGVCVPWGARHFARAVLWLLRHDAATRSAMGKRGQRWVIENRTYTHIADELERIYLELLADRSVARTGSPRCAAPQE
jgi:glycosyltransferase involved in cell wall biosynthesis